jgi:hypothetical protein
VKGTRRIPLEGDVKADAPRTPSAANATRNSAEPPGYQPTRAESGETGPIPIATTPRDDGVSASRENAVAAACPAVGGELPDLRDFIRSRRAALAGFMEQGASLHLDGDRLAVIPRSDIYIRYLTDNRSVIAELASELYGRRIRVEVAAGAPPRAAEITPEIPASVESKGGVTHGERALANGTVAGVASSAVEGSGGPAPGRAAVSANPVPATGGGTGSSTVSAQAKTDARQRLYGDPVVRRLFEELDARLVDVKTGPPNKQTGEENDDK